MPRLQPNTYLKLRAADRNLSHQRKTKFKEGLQPWQLKRIPAFPKIVHNRCEVLVHIMWKHELVVQFRPPPNKLALVWPLPQHRKYASEQKQLSDAELFARRHVECTQLQQSKSSTCAVGRVELVD